MLVFWEQRLVVLATPKTGSTALATSLESLSTFLLHQPPILKHTPLRRFNRFLRPYLETSAGARFTVAAVMREPRDWLGSWYRFRRREFLEDPTKSTRGISFEEFTQGYCTAQQPDHAAIGTQSAFLDSCGEAPVDHLFRYAEMDRFIAFLEDRLGKRIFLPRINVSPRMDLTLSSTTETLLHETLARDFTLYQSLTGKPAAAPSRQSP